MASEHSSSLTELLHRWRGGENGAADQLISAIYPELRQLAGRYLRPERREHTLQPTALINEVYLRLLEADVHYADRVHFLAIAATTMRRVLIDHAKARAALKRGGDQVRVTWADSRIGAENAIDVLDLDRSLRRLAEHDQRMSRALELHFFGGMTYDETAEALGTSVATVNRELRFAKAWLLDDLRSDRAR